ncbi:BPL-N domain-containing protein [Mucilaginibacter flavidus]|uniref:BPL-N domain-containing protein n=1 Tax=Mucilaginibacter flavidus TaxID=2949309 RepID=UPI002093CB8B|nr:BPL-N domain-containing protein [Mucilaginibacter flavidus]MCO5947186.1 BPL-N domain-containing protein [Mucilaginibacter flavidus]
MKVKFIGKPNLNLHTADGKLRRTFVSVLFSLAITAFTACTNHKHKSNSPTGGVAQILLFNGTGTSPNDVSAIEAILKNNHLYYTIVNSSELNNMSELQMRKYRLLIIPGGNFIDMGKSLAPATTARVHNAVKHGLNYLGICAGGFLAGSSAYYNGFNLASGVCFGFYAAENQGTRKAVAITTPGAPAQDQYWEDGPQFTGWGAVAGKYPDGTPAIVQGTYGEGWIMLVGFHAEAPEDWRTGIKFNTTTKADNTCAGLIIRAAFYRAALPHF